ncbi:MAG: 1-acyl-sn-glycerol-3-phosphate acyltransferase [Eggerthellaceae bacterium]|nr:1-acyl-sn-glycerol-3-phosphate acyltransferase [Eggerthellaceae bacterium]
MRAKRVIYYTDPINDDFATGKIKTKTVDATHKFVNRNIIWNVSAMILYYLVAAPLILMISKFYLGVKFENRAVLKQVRRGGYFLYGNHTRDLDAFLPALSAFPKRVHIIAHANAVSTPILKHIVVMLGAIPVPSGTSGMKGFLEAVDLRIKEKRCVAIYPEAHIWPFYTGIRPFTETSFWYPVKMRVPAVAMVVTYRRRAGVFRIFKKPGMTITFSEPFFADDKLSPKRAQKKLRDEVYCFMTKISSEKENIEYIKYVRRPHE